MGGGVVSNDFETGPDSLVFGPMAMESSGEKPKRTLVLLGRTGNGKSATGNSILGETKFPSKARGKSVTKQCALHTSDLLNGLKVNVIDTPGLFSASTTTKFTSGEEITSEEDFTSGEIVRCLGLAKDGIDAMLLVFSVRNRLTEEEQSTLSKLKILFGSEIVEYIVVVFTNGDVLEDGDTLEDYLEDCPEFSGILKECNDRKVLFDNRPDISESKKEKQLQYLLKLVNQISRKNNGKPFMPELSLELRKKRKQIEEKRKQIEAKQGVSSKQEISQLKKDLDKSYKLMLKEMEEKVSNQLKESMGEVKEQLLKAETAREEAEKKMNEIHKQSSDKIRELREQLDKAMKESAALRTELDKKCTVL